MRIAFARWRSGGLFNRPSPRKRLLPKRKTSSRFEFVSGLADGASAMPAKWSSYLGCRAIPCLLFGPKRDINQVLFPDTQLPSRRTWAGLPPAGLHELAAGALTPVLIVPTWHHPIILMSAKTIT